MKPSKSKCKSCGAAIFWAKTSNGRAMPVDAEPSPEGNVDLFVDGDGNLVCNVVAQPSFHAKQLRTSHFVTCPDADKHRRR